MNGNEVIGIGFGIVGFCFLFSMYLSCSPILNNAGEDIKWLWFGLGLFLWFAFAFIMGNENWR